VKFRAMLFGTLWSFSFAAPAALPVAEKLVIQYPADFDIALNKDGFEPKDWLGFVPRGESAESWTLKLGSRSDPGGAKLDPEQYFDKFAREVSEQCEGSEVFGGKSREKAGSYVAFIGFIYCNKEKSGNAGEVAAYRMISGDDAMYIVKMAKRVTPFTSETKPTDINLQYMETLVRRSSVCRGKKC